MPVFCAHSTSRDCFVGLCSRPGSERQLFGRPVRAVHRLERLPSVCFGQLPRRASAHAAAVDLVRGQLHCTGLTSKQNRTSEQSEWVVLTGERTSVAVPVLWLLR
jgi:hypothetical protein